MNRHLRLSFLLAAVFGLNTACLTVASTPYNKEASKYDNEFGRSMVYGDKLTFSVFMGNGATTQLTAKKFSQLAAVEECRVADEVALLKGTVNFNKKQNYLYTTTSTYSVPSYSRYRQSYSRTSTYPVTVEYPRYATGFICAKRVRAFEDDVKFEVISKELVHPYTRDFQGGIRVIKDASSSKRLKAFKDGDVIIAINGLRIEKYDPMEEKLFFANSSRKTAKVRIIRDQQLITVNARLQDLTESVKELNEDVVEDVCDYINKTEQIEVCEK